MFCDLVGSTALSARLDPEDLREVIGAYHAAAPRRSRRSAASSPNIWATACWPISAIRRRTSMTPSAPCRPGWRWSRRCRSFDARPAPLQVRIGIATGLVVVGDLIGSGEAQERGIVGETPNLAARLQGARRTGHGRHRREHPPASRRSVRLATSGRTISRASTSRCRPGQALRRERVESRFEACTAACAAGRPRGGDRAAAAALGQAQGGRRPGRAALRRSRHRQVAAHCGINGAARRRAAHAAALLLLAAAHRQRAPSGDRPVGTRRRL